MYYVLKPITLWVFSVSTVLYENFVFAPYKFSTYNRENDDDLLLLIMHVDKNKYVIYSES